MISIDERGVQSVSRVLVRAGATADGAERIARLLLESGLSAREARDWLAHPDLAYPHPQPAQVYGGVSVGGLVAGSEWCLHHGREDLVIEGATAYATASDSDSDSDSDSERTIAWLFSGNIPDVRTLTGSDPARAQTMVAIARLMLERLGTSQAVADVASATLTDQHDRIRDRLKNGEEQTVLGELQDGILDLQALSQAPWRDPTW